MQYGVFFFTTINQEEYLPCQKKRSQSGDHGDRSNLHTLTVFNNKKMSEFRKLNWHLSPDKNCQGNKTFQFGIFDLIKGHLRKHQFPFSSVDGKC